MDLIADVLLIAAALSAAAYCHVLARRLRRLRDLDGGVGAAIATLSTQAEEMKAALAAARNASGDSAKELAQSTARAEMAAGRLELLLASVHDEDGARPALSPARRAAREAAEDEADDPMPADAAPEAASGGTRVSALHAALAALARDGER